VRQRSGCLDGEQETTRQLPLPARERGIGRPAVIARVQLNGLKLPGVVVKASLSRQARGVEDVRPVRVTPAGSSDVDRHNGYSAIREQSASRCAYERATLRRSNRQLQDCLYAMTVELSRAKSDWRLVRRRIKWRWNGAHLRGAKRPAVLLWQPVRQNGLVLPGPLC
jgi:hypothetical protein